MMTPEHLSAIDARAEAATEGPWTADHEFGSVYAAVKPGTVICTLNDPFVRDTNGADLEFIANSRDDIDTLRAEVRRLSADLTAMTAAAHEYFAADAALNEAFANTRFAAPDMARQMAEEHSRAIVRAQTARRALREMAGMKR